MPFDKSALCTLRSAFYCQNEDLFNSEYSKLSQNQSQSISKNDSEWINLFRNLFQNTISPPKTSDPKDSNQSDPKSLLNAYSFAQKGHFSSALNFINDQSLDHLLLAIYCFISLNRLDIASRVLTQMISIDEDDICSIIAFGILSLYTNEKQNIETSINNLKDLEERFGPSTFLKNTLALMYWTLNDPKEAINLFEEIDHRIPPSDKEFSNGTETIKNNSIINSVNLSAKNNQNKILSTVSFGAIPSASASLQKLSKAFDDASKA